MKADQALAAMLVVSALCGTEILAQSLKSERRVGWPGDGSRLVDLMKDGDTLLVIEKWRHREPLQEDADLASELRTRVENADDVFEAEVIGVVPTLIDDGGWVRTEIVVNRRKVFKTGETKRAQATRRRTIVHDGGEIVLNGVTLKVGYYPIIRKGKRYLMFTTTNPKDGTIHSGPAFLIDRGALVHSETSERIVPSVLNGLKLSEVSRIITGR